MTTENDVGPSSSARKFELLSPETLFFVALVASLIIIAMHNYAGSYPPAYGLQQAIGRLLAALFWPWVLWLVFRAVQGRENAPSLRRFVIGGALILLPLLTVSVAVNVLRTISPEHTATLLNEACHANWSEAASMGLEHSNVELYCACYSSSLISSMTSEELSQLRSNPMDASWATERIGTVARECNIARLYAPILAGSLRSELPMAIDDGVVIQDAQANGSVVSVIYQLQSEHYEQSIFRALIHMQESFCGDSELSEMMNYGVIIQSTFLNVDDELLFERQLDLEGCEK